MAGDHTSTYLPRNCRRSVFARVWGRNTHGTKEAHMDSHDSATFLRRSLQLDGVASGVTGVLLLGAAGPVSTLIGNAAPGIARLVGALLVVYAAALLWNARRITVARG